MSSERLIQGVNCRGGWTKVMDVGVRSSPPFVEGDDWVGMEKVFYMK